MITHQASGMVEPSATNPLDKVPIGPQVFPFGTPSENQSQINPYYATNYQAGQTANVIQSTEQVILKQSIKHQLHKLLKQELIKHLKHILSQIIKQQQLPK